MGARAGVRLSRKPCPACGRVVAWQGGGTDHQPVRHTCTPVTAPARETP